MAPRYSREPDDARTYTRAFDRAYTALARPYDLAIRALPLWRTWLRHALPLLQGPRVLEVSFGTGDLLCEYASRFEEVHGVDLNARMVTMARAKLLRVQPRATVCRAGVEALPYRTSTFDTVLNTMAFSGYPRAVPALAELLRVLKPSGRLVMIDINYPVDGNWLGKGLVTLWKSAGDLVRDLHPLFARFAVDYTDEEIGGHGSVHLYVVRKRAARPAIMW